MNIECPQIDCNRVNQPFSSSLLLLTHEQQDELFELDKELLFTGDYNMQGSSPVPPVQGGFLVVKPSVERFEEYKRIIKKVTTSLKSNLIYVS